eukprot:TRINITY_DN1268_c0_g3_i1.p1 TRINITY_DN1268_c0_g3~~TRINITY_DN1268_c0_g3_i1.p1  ORF type:complete len:270 (-),score=43.40 TRINITY_DN1268_c0_g3_i1:967-1776(-)
MHCNDQAVVLFAPMRIHSVSPRCGPACGGTVISVVGTGLEETGKIAVRFTSGDKQVEARGRYVEQCYTDHNPTLESVFCTTPNFEESFKVFPQKMSISISLDGAHYIDCGTDFLVYSTAIKINNAHPKCGSVLGGTELSLMVDIDPLTSQHLFHLCFGFQERQQTARKCEEKKRSKAHSKLSHSGTHASIGCGGDVINPLNPGEKELVLGDWHCAVAKYEGGRMSCKVPKLASYNPEALQYNVDVALNGQQFSGCPVIFHYYGEGWSLW